MKPGRRDAGTRPPPAAWTPPSPPSSPACRAP